MLLMIPMTYAAITGILSYRRMVFANRVHKIALTASLVYITASVPLHLYVGVRAAVTSASTCTWPATGSATGC